ncbi:hypothetical protein C0995_009424 [Termitomyces sp. Mi166|nr:hypothetical protein C0995_009424 [Termitomyces sp. Mi166\
MSCPEDAKPGSASNDGAKHGQECEITKDGNGEHDSQWIAIEPPSSSRKGSHTQSLYCSPPSFRESQFDIIFRRQRLRPRDGGGRKLPGLPSRFLHLPNDFEFAGWGSLTRINLTEDDRKAGENRLQEIRRQNVFGQFTASALAGNAVLGSVFYALPAVVAVSSVYSPISLFIATLILFLWRPIMEELGSALPLSGAPYTYILNVSSKSFALIGAALLILDFTSTSVVSAATAASYLGGETQLPFPEYIAAILVLVVFTIISLSGVKESARIALVVLLFHMGTMMVLIILSCVHWGRTGSQQLRDNWNSGRASSSSVAHEIFNGVCLGMLGLTGFECTPSYIGRIKKGSLPLVLRNLHLPAIALNTTIMLLVLAVVPFETILQGSNVLSVLAQTAAGKWLRRWIVVDAFIVLCGGVLTGILSACELLEQLALHRVLPNFFLRTLPTTRALYVSVLSFMVFSGILYVSAGASLNVISQMFSLVWLTVMSLFPLTLLLLKFNRGRIPRSSHTPLAVIIAAILVSIVVFVGNITVNPATANKNEETSCVKMIYFHEGEAGIPSELEANAKILDEAFPEITVDLIIVNAPFDPSKVLTFLIL